MWTQRDQIQAYQFLRRRLVSALVAADANHPTSPSRRLVLGTTLGVAAAVLVAAGFGVVGLLNPSGAGSWQQGGQVIVEQQTGARYVLGSDGLLHPVLNYASARLLAGGDGSKTVTVAAATLASASRGGTLGIPGAPDSLPAANRMTAGTFVSCSQSQPNTPADTEPTATVILGKANPAGQHTLAAGQGVLVRLLSGTEFLLTSGHRFRLPDQASRAALGYDGRGATLVAASWLNTVPAGRDLGLVMVPGAGAGAPTGSTLATRVGQVVTDGQYYLVRADGLELISQTEAQLILGDQDNTIAYPNGRPAAAHVSVAAVAAAPRSAITEQADPASYPDTVPAVADLPSGQALCAAGDGTDSANLLIGPNLPLPSGAKPMTTLPTDDVRVAQQVYVPPGTGALVRARTNPLATGTATYLITDTGQKYPVPSAAAVSALGYGSVSAGQASDTLLALLPTGPDLDPVAAEQQASDLGR